MPFLGGKETAGLSEHLSSHGRRGKQEALGPGWVSTQPPRGRLQGSEQPATAHGLLALSLLPLSCRCPHPEVLSPDLRSHRSHSLPAGGALAPQAWKERSGPLSFSLPRGTSLPPPHHCGIWTSPSQTGLCSPLCYGHLVYQA